MVRQSALVRAARVQGLGKDANRINDSKVIGLAAVGSRVELHLPRTWTSEENPSTRPHETEAYDPVALEGYDPESTPWRPR
jgi:hypothetical protein